MKCTKCGFILRDNAKFCDNCGKAVEKIEVPQESFVFTDDEEIIPIENNPVKTQSRKFNWTLVIAITVLFGLFIFNTIGFYSKNSINKEVYDYVDDTEVMAFEEISPPSDIPTQVFTEPPTEDPIELENNFKDKCESVEIEKVARTPDDFVDKCIKITGVVTSVSGRSSTLIALKPLVSDGVSYCICVEAFLREGDTRIFEGDTLTCWGVLKGKELYVKTNNQTVELPTLDLEYYEIQ